MSLQGAIDRIEYHLNLLDGIKGVPVRVPESANQFPFGVVYPESGNLQAVSDWMKAIHVLIVEIHCERTLLGAAIEQATGYITSFPKRLLDDPTLNNQVDTIIADGGQSITYQFGRLEWGGLQTIGIRFRVPVKIQEAI